MHKPFRIGVLASTRGTDLQAIFEAIQNNTLTGVKVAVVISNVPGCGALEKAKTARVPAVFINPKGKNRETYDQALAAVLDKYTVDLIVLIGYMRILSPWFVRHFPKRIINVHPALLPAFGGKGFFGANVHEAVLHSGATETGCTIHYVDEGCDTGEIILQKKITITPKDTPETLKEKVQALEKEWYPKVIASLAKKSAHTI